MRPELTANNETLENEGVPALPPTMIIIKTTSGGSNIHGIAGWLTIRADYFCS